MRGRVARHRVRTAALAGVALAATAGPLGAQSYPGGVGAGAAGGVGGVGGTGQFGLGRTPYLPDFYGSDPLARGAGFQPYVEVGQRASISQNFRLYAEATAGLSAFINRDRAQGTFFVRLTERAPEIGRASNQFTVSGLGRGTFDLVRNRLFLDLSAFADATPRDVARGVNIDPAKQVGNLSQIYYVSAAPRFQTEIGDLAIFKTGYRASYTAISNRLSGGSGFSNGGGANAGGANNLQLAPLSNTFSQAVDASIANVPRDGRFEIKLSGRLGGDEQERLKQRFRTRRGAVDLTYALTRPVALLGNVGYEDYRSTQQSILRAPFYVTTTPVGSLPPFTALTGSTLFLPSFPPQFPVLIIPGATLGQSAFLAQGFTGTQNLADPTIFRDPFLGGGPVQADITPVLNTFGDYSGDPTAPRQTTYEQKGLVWNGGFRYTPTRRTLFELRVGKRFSDVTVTGSVLQQFRNGLTITGSLTDGIETFASILTSTVNGVPTSFVSNGHSGGGLGGCVRGVDLTQSSGCVDNAFQSVSSGVFRSRYGRIGAEWDRGKTTYGIEYSYNNRRYLDAGASTGPSAPPLDPTLVHREDVSQRVYARVTHRLDLRQTIDAGLFVGNYDLGLSRVGNDSYVGVDGRYNLRINRRFDAFANATVTQRSSGRIGNNIFSSLGVGGRYNF